jgi:hypothetical protein
MGGGWRGPVVGRVPGGLVGGRRRPMDNRRERQNPWRSMGECQGICLCLRPLFIECQGICLFSIVPFQPQRADLRIYRSRREGSPTKRQIPWMSMPTGSAKRQMPWMSVTLGADC